MVGQPATWQYNAASLNLIDAQAGPRLNWGSSAINNHQRTSKRQRLTVFAEENDLT